MEEVMSKAAMLKGMLQGGHSSTQASQHSGLTIGTGLPIGAPVKTVGDVLALIQKYVGGGGGGAGQKGDSGPQGLQGPQGETGSMGPAGPAGPQGEQGISAYEVALIEGFVGTEAEWLASLVGPQGEQGEQGEVGPAGADGGGATVLNDLTDVDLTTPPTDGQVLVFDEASGTWVAGDQTGGVGGGGSADDLTAFKGATTSGINSAGSTSSFATKGIAFRVERECTITAMSGHIGGSGSSVTSQYRFDIYELSSITIDANDDRYATDLTVGSLVGSTTSAAIGTTEVKYLQLPMVENVVLEAGVEYIGVAVLTNGVGTTPNRITTSTLVNGWILSAPVTTFRGAFLFNSIDLSEGQTPNSSGDGTYTIGLIGTESLGSSIGSGNQPQPVDLGLFINGQPLAEEVVYRTVLARELTLAGNMAGSYAYVGVNPTTAAAAFLIKRNGSSIGQVIIGTSGTASFTTNGPGDSQVFAAGDLLEVTAPTTQNASMADISITLVFTREV